MIRNTFVVDNSAKSIFIYQLPKDWLIREQNPDFYIDYFIELNEENEPSGKIFEVQLKGTANLRTKKNQIVFSMKTQHLIYYLEKAQLPVYLVVVDVKAKVCYWLFLQKYLTELKKNKWKEQRTLSIKIPQKNILKETDAFLNDFYYSLKYMRDLHPSSIDAAIKKKLDYWKSLDPRFKINVHSIDGMTNYELITTESIPLKLYLTGGKEASLSNLIEKNISNGKDFTLQKGQFDIKGSKLIAEVMQETESLRFSPIPILHKFTSILSASNKSGGIISSISLNGQAEIRNNYFQFRGDLENAPLHLNFKVQFGKVGNKFQGDYSLEFPFEKWDNRSISFLPYLEKLFELTKYLSKGLKFNIEMEYQGKKLFDSMKVFKKPQLDEIVFLLDFITKLGKVGKQFDTNFIFDSNREISHNDKSNLEILYGLCISGEYELDGHGHVGNAILLRENANNDLTQQHLNEEKVVGPLSVQSSNEFKIYGKVIKISKIEYNLNKAIITTKRDNLKNDEIAISWEGAMDSKLIIKLL